MKSNRLLALLLAMLLVLSACGTKQSSSSSASNDKVDVDLTVLSSTMVYSEVYAMLYTPEDYEGKTVKMSGTFAVYEGPERNYYACIISDATACCSQGIEFQWKGTHSYPQDYPMIDQMIEVIGTFQYYEEDGQVYCELVDADLKF